MKENNVKVEARTLKVIRAELDEKVSEYNESTDGVVRNELELEHKKLVDEYNQLSLLTAYAGFLEDKSPLIALGKAYTYATISTKDNRHPEVINGVKHIVITRSVEDGPRMLSITKFLVWAKEKNHQIATDKLYLEKYGAAREEVNRQWKRYWSCTGENTKLEIGKMKKALQALFDALVFIAGPSGKNSLVANGDMAKYALGVANNRKVDLTKKKQTVINMTSSNWEQVSMDIWNMVCSNKSYDVLIGDEKPEEETPAAEAPAASETPAHAAAK